MRVILIDSFPLVREGVRCVLEREGSASLIATAGNGREGLALVEARQPDLIITELLLPGVSGIDVVRRIRAINEGVVICALTGLSDRRTVIDAFAAGVDGYLLKSDPLEVFTSSVRALRRGAQLLTPGLPLEVREYVQQHGSSPPPDLLAPLTARERQVFDLIIRGRSTNATARELAISAKTVETHRTRINTKLGCHSTADLIRFAAWNGLLPPSHHGPRVEHAGAVSVAAGV
jgi:DNA-binding NarL/FixJ family response regulator